MPAPKKCPLCQQNTVIEVPIGLVATRSMPGNVYLQLVCHNPDCQYRELNLLAKNQANSFDGIL